jgi:phosphoenolpyruvate carboxykinase (GTP)
MKTNPNMVRTLKASNSYPTLFTNVALNPETNEPWWEGLDGAVPEHLLDWQGQPWDPQKMTKAAHPNSRFTVSIYNSPTLSREYDNPRGVPISAIILGGRRSKLIPLITEAFNWEHGVFMGARMGSETTAAAAGRVGVLRRDPMAMLPFCGYNMGNYFKHWIGMGRLLSRPPRIYALNAFRTNEKGEFLWPGFGENIRILKWIVDRVNGRASAKETPLGWVPDLNSFPLDGLNIPRSSLQKLFEVSPGEWSSELDDCRTFLSQFGPHMPYEIWRDYNKMAARLQSPK